VADTATASAIPSSLLSAVFEINRVVRNIDISVSAIAGRTAPAPPSSQSAVTQTFSAVNQTPPDTGVAEILRKIGADVSVIAKRGVSLTLPAALIVEPPVTRNTGAADNALLPARGYNPPLPAVFRSREGGETVSENPRRIAPVTQAERAAFIAERREKLAIEVSAAKGTEARIIAAPKRVDVKLVKSGGFA
jgi:hypothetical protein